MIGARIVFQFELEARTQLHIGNGTVRPGSVEDPDDALQSSPAQIAEVMKDHQGRPYIPGSTLKGCLRRRLSQCSSVFGLAVEGPNQSEREAGKVIFSNAYLHPDAAQGLDTVTQIAIDDETGVAEKARLFTREVVPKGARFTARIICPQAFAVKEDNGAAHLMSVLLSCEGVRLGKGTRQAAGLLKTDTSSFSAHLVVPGAKEPEDVTETWTTRIAAAEVPSEALQTISVTLRSNAPFLISDPDRTPPKNDKTTPQIRGRQDTATGAPLLTGATLLGALRAKSAWLEANMYHGTMDDKDAVHTDPQQASDLTRTQRLFGITGWQGQLAAKRIELKNTPPLQKVTSVRIDRFSAAPIDNALYTVEGWLAPEFRVQLTFDPRNSSEADDDWRFLQQLLGDLSDEVWGGIDLGFGKTRGFGSFSVEIANG